MWEKMVIIGLFGLCLTSSADFSNRARIYHGVGQAHTIEIKRELANKRFIAMTQANLIFEAQTNGDTANTRLV